MWGKGEAGEGVGGGEWGVNIWRDRQKWDAKKGEGKKFLYTFKGFPTVSFTMYCNQHFLFDHMITTLPCVLVNRLGHQQVFYEKTLAGIKIQQKKGAGGWEKKLFLTNSALYPCESYILTAQLQRRICAMEMRCSRMILYVSYKDHITSEKAHAKIQQEIEPHEDLS